ncbi:hypothetical protein QIA30_05540 (plasmid) [Borreliella turdi]|uniref:hypothetical protein n=1 Tax=Borreliella turdi TaxID=57863 RepID=UPI003AEF3C5D
MLKLFDLNSLKKEEEVLLFTINRIDSVIMLKYSFKEFDSGNVKSLFFKKLDVNVYSESFKRLA